jgi:hypothetical protein
MRRRRSVEHVAAGLAAALALAPGDARAYCLTSACPGDVAGNRCTPPQSEDCGVPLFWRGRCVGYSLQKDASVQIDLATAATRMRQAFDAWQNVDCGGAEKPSIELVELVTVTCSAREYNKDVGNANLVVFRDTSWPYGGLGNTLALTTLTYNLDSGEIFDADLEINATSGVRLTTSDSMPVYDLLSILTHEGGHFLGLGHSPVEQATMYIEYVPGTLELRSLEADDAAAICKLYPPGAATGACDPTPRHGFSDTCGAEQRDDAGLESGCGCAVAGAPEAEPRWLLVVGALATLGAGRFVARGRRSRRASAAAHAQGAGSGGAGVRPASRRSAMSSSRSGFGVVSKRSP